MFNVVPNIMEIEKYCELVEKEKLSFEYNDFYHPEILDNKEELNKRIELYLSYHQKRDFDTFHGVFLDIVPFSEDSMIRECSRKRMYQSIEIAQKLGCRGVVFHTNICPQLMLINGYKERWAEQNIHFIEELVKESSDIEIWYENMFDETPEALCMLGEALVEEKRFGVCLDIAHAMLQKLSMEQWFLELSPYIRHFHMNDCNLQYDQHLPLGDGKIPWSEIWQFIEKYHLQDRSKLFEVNGYERAAKCLSYYKQKIESINK